MSSTDDIIEPPVGPTTPAPAGPAASTPLTGDWPAQAADAIVDLVATVRDRTVTPLLTVVRGVVYGLVIMMAAVAAVVLLLIATIRLLDIALPGEVWSAYLLLGSVFTVVGLVLWSKRYSPG
ncbi:MAG: hypothetical protein ACXIVQ_07810 [Acidimicrobiales bacterium]